MRFLPTERNRLIMWRKESTLIKDSVMESDSVKNYVAEMYNIGYIFVAWRSGFLNS